MVEPDGVTDNVRGKSVPAIAGRVAVHPSAYSASCCLNLTVLSGWPIGRCFQASMPLVLWYRLGFGTMGNSWIAAYEDFGKPKEVIVP